MAIAESDAMRAARWFRSRFGWNVLPSRSWGRKAPICPFAEYWEEPIPWTVFDRWDGINIQIMTGGFWGLAVLDLDGPAAISRWARRRRYCPPTWIVRSGGGGEHWWFRIPKGSTCPSRDIWTDGRKHSKIEILGDRKLVMAPPSVHPETKRPYQWKPGHGPRDMQEPARMPQWLIDCPGLESPKPDVVARVVPSGPALTVPGQWDRARVLDAIPACDRVHLVRQWGLRLRGEPGGRGWIACHAIGRDDRNPSAGFHPESAVYVEPATGERLSLFDIGVALGRYATWQDACNDLGKTYGVEG